MGADGVLPALGCREPGPTHRCALHEYGVEILCRKNGFNGAGGHVLMTGRRLAWSSQKGPRFVQRPVAVACMPWSPGDVGDGHGASQ